MKKKGFTLAEVLITLGIIGIVAAITMPTLMTDTKYKQVGVKLAKFHTNLENAAKAYAAENESIETIDDFKRFINKSYSFKNIYTTNGNTPSNNANLAATKESGLVGSKNDFSQNYAVLKDDTKLAFSAANANEMDLDKYPEKKYGTPSFRVYFNPNVTGLPSSAQSIHTFIVTTTGNVVPIESSDDICTKELYMNNWIVKQEYYSPKASTTKQGGKDVDVPGACYKG